MVKLEIFKDYERLFWGLVMFFIILFLGICIFCFLGIYTTCWKFPISIGFVLGVIFVYALMRVFKEIKRKEA